MPVAAITPILYSFIWMRETNLPPGQTTATQVKRPYTRSRTTAQTRPKTRASPAVMPVATANEYGHYQTNPPERPWRICTIGSTASGSDIFEIVLGTFHQTENIPQVTISDAGDIALVQKVITENNIFGALSFEILFGCADKLLSSPDVVVLLQVRHLFKVLLKTM